MDIGTNIKRIRKAKDLTQKEIFIAASMDSAQYSRIENGKTDPSVSTLEKIAKALGVTLSELFATDEDIKEINSLDKTIMEKVRLIENLSEEEKKTIYNILDAFISKEKLRNTLSTVLKEIA